MLNYLFNIISHIFILSNSFLRLNYPSNYCPATQSKIGFLYSPIIARSLATITEIIFYTKLLYFYDLYNIKLFYLIILGETLSWGYLLLQSDLLGFCEDSTWTILQFYLYVNSNNPLKYLLSYPYIIYMLVQHLPRTYKLINFNNLFKFYSGSTLKIPNSYCKSWLYPSLTLKPIIWLIINIK